MTKNAILFGDSYSTFKGYVPASHAIYYSETGHPESGVAHVSNTWWHQVAAEADLHLVRNDSWSGSTIGYTGYDNADCSQSSSFIYRLRTLEREGFFEQNTIDTVLVFGGTNDSWSNAPLGELKFEDFEEKDLYNVLPAIAYFFCEIKRILPQAAVYGLVNTELKPEITDAFEQVCKRYGVTKIAFDKIDKVNSHPTARGMEDIKEAVVSALRG
ncbi:MAG: hypothetical protein IIW40_00100 [Clostridia bacterium]|nr:hypothetical protein [Clostridia bacterium]